MKGFGGLLLFSVLLIPLLSCEAQVLSPEEALVFLRRSVEHTLSRDYWAVWQFRDGVTGEERFVEVLFVRGLGFAWRELGEEQVMNVRLGNCRYVVNLESGEVESVYPLLEFPFVPLEEEAFPLLLENYLLDLRDGELVLIARRTQETVCALLLGEEDEIIGQRVYAPGGKILEEWKLLYRDVSPEPSRVSLVVRLFESLRGEAQLASPLPKLERTFLLPDFVPLGFQLRRAYLLRNEGKEFYGFVYSDGFASFLLLQSVYPFQVSGSRILRYFRFASGGGTNIAAEKGGFYFLLLGGLDPRVGQEILKLLSERGGRE